MELIIENNVVKGMLDKDAAVDVIIPDGVEAIADNALSLNSSFNLQTLMTAISYADTINLVTLSAFVSSVFAVVFGCAFKLFN